MVALDKIGTLTRGRPEFVSVASFDGEEPDRVLALAAAAEARSEHPLAAAVLKRAGERRVSVPAASDTRAVAGRGVEATVEGRRLLVGSERLFSDLDVLDEAAFEAAREREARGLTTILVRTAPAGDGAAAVPRILGAIGVADRARPASVQPWRSAPGSSRRRRSPRSASSGAPTARS